MNRWCLWLSVVLLLSCYRLNAQQPYSVFWIISPKNGATVSSGLAPVRFEWTAPWMAEYSDFEIKITEIMSGQTAAAALNSNTPLLRQRLPGMYIETGALIPGRGYAWQVRYLHSSDSSKDLLSEPLQFQF